MGPNESNPCPAIALTQAPEAFWLKGLFWAFILSFSLDYRAADGQGSGSAQWFFLALCLGSGAALIALGRRFLFTRPGIFLIAGWGAFLVFMLGNAFLQGVPPGRSLRIALPFLLGFLSLAVTHVVACAGIKPAEIVKPLFVAACINIVARIGHGFLFQNLTLENVRFEIQSPVNSWLCAWLGCALLLRPKFHPSLLIACTLLFTGIFISITRSLAFPIFTAVLATSLCFLLGASWGLFPWSAGFKRLLPASAAVGFVVLFLAVFALVQPVVIDRWQERLFHNAEGRNLTADISYLTRAAEADAIMEILNDDPIHYLHGHGIGASYYWHPAYLPEIWKVLPKEETEVEDIWFAGHSIWTHGLFSGGLIAIAAYLAAFGWTAFASLASARANAAVPGPDLWLAFLPFVATLCLLSETITANPFQERLIGIFFGAMAALPQAFMIRASWLHSLFARSDS